MEVGTVLTIAQQIVSREIDRALTKYQVAANSRIRAEVQARADWDSVSASSVRVFDDNNRILTLDTYLAELRRDPGYSQRFSSSATAGFKRGYRQIA